MLTYAHLYKQTALKGDISITSEEIYVQDGGDFTLTANQYFYAILRSGNKIEYIKVTATEKSGRWTVVRAQEGSTALQLKAGTCVLIYPTPSMITLAVDDSTASSSVTPGEYCLDDGACLTIDAQGHVTGINTGSTPC